MSKPRWVDDKRAVEYLYELKERAMEVLAIRDRSERVAQHMIVVGINAFTPDFIMAEEVRDGLAVFRADPLRVLEYVRKQERIIDFYARGFDRVDEEKKQVNHYAYYI